MPQKKLAALDLGSNTFRLLIANLAEGTQKIGLRRIWQEIPRLSQGLTLGSKLKPEPKNRAWTVLEGFQHIIEDQAPGRVLAGATMAFREAQDGADFLAQIHHKFGWETILLSGVNEARLTAQGVLMGLDPIPKAGLIFDIGGRSTEFIQTAQRDIVETKSLQMGVVGLTESFISTDPPTATELDNIAQHVRSLLDNCHWPIDSSFSLVGTAGTVTTVAAMLMKMADYDSDKVNNQCFRRKEIGELLKTLAGEPITARLTHLGLHPRRADVIVAGLVLVTVVMDYFKKDSLIVSDNSLLEGLWLAAANLIPLSP
jgi:exopolyphosphatase/guanosine-5'-triphosphate,3'-diphosphate pyrophosphatase